MKILHYPQLSPEWWAAKVGSIGGGRFGQVKSNRENRLVYELIEEILNGYCNQDDFINDDMQFGIDNEPIARDLYSEKSGIMFREVGLIKSDYSDIHHASPDGLSDSNIVLEIKSTENSAIHIQRYFNGPETSYMPQIINYFAVSDEITEVHWLSYCPYRFERPLIPFIFFRNTVIGSVKIESEIDVIDAKGNTKKKTVKIDQDYTINDVVIEARTKIKALEAEIANKIQEFTF